MKKGNKVAFTLVELIVVITILAILATIGFVSFSGYLSLTRDTNRISQLKSMSDALELYRTKKDLPIPDYKIDIQYSGSTIAYQGYIGKNVLETIEYTESGLDPKDKQYFSYYLTKNKKYFQLLAFLEEEDSDVVALNNFNKTFATDYSDRYPKTTGKKLGILTDEFNTPIQELPTITSSGYLDIYDVGDTEYKSILKGDDVLTGTRTTFQPVKRFAEVGGKFCSVGNVDCVDPNVEPEWTQIIKVNSTLSDLAKFGDTSDIESTFYTDTERGIGWGTNDDTRRIFKINKKYSKILIIFSGKYNDPSGGLGYLHIDNEEENSDDKKILALNDGRSSDSQGQSLFINGNEIYDKEEKNELNREKLIDYGESDLINLKMKGYTDDYPYTKRYIKELWIKK